jgi:protein involved in polysaccharide export with SLBB domain
MEAMHLSTKLLLFLALVALAGFPTAARCAAGTGVEAVSHDAPAQVRKASVEAPDTALRGPVDEGLYVVGPGDVLTVTLWGRSDMTQTVTVSPEGAVIIPGVAPVPVAGLKLRDAKGRMVARLREIYRNVEIGVALTRLRTMRINVLGSVAVPGEYTGTALDLASALIDRAGGLLEGASDRNIEIRRRAGEVSRLDLARYLQAGDMSGNPPVLDGDVIVVPQAVSFVYVYGAVGRPGRYELAPGDTFESIIELAGGFSRGAVADTVILNRFVDDSTTRALPLDVGDPDDRSTPLLDGDQLYVQFRNDWRVATLVQLSGEVMRPGPYGINEGSDRLSDVLRRAGGPTDEASLSEATIIRSAESDTSGLEFQRLKDVPVASMSDTEYAYWSSKMREVPGRMVLDLRKALEGSEEHDVLLRDRDLILVPEARFTVEVSGQVANPGKVAYVEGERFTYYVRAAGGYEEGARRGGTRVVRAATGEWVPAGRAGALQPGDEIWVPERREGSTWSFIKDLTQVLASAATAYLLIDQITK